MDTPRTPPTQQLTGYELVECIGAGAYGEVWRANAPGGLTKAIKYVFGQLDGKRATSELKALERVKAVRHPFLLSLERIEVVEGRLIVVSELADESLRDRFRACIQTGQPGIPRDELLRHLHEAAEALDYLAEQHDLQHLDVKPENLLLLAGHVKVADFGLVKSMSDQAQSLIGGMTPIYAAPEVFQGSPSWRSDQYSLAVMYQELLTGGTPFDGANAAELTMRHLNDEPDLSSLSEGDRFVLSRALSKSPEHRFDSCVAFAKALAEADQSGSFGSPTTVSTAAPTASATAGAATEVFDDDEATQAASRASIQIDLPPVPDSAIKFVDPPTLNPNEFTPAPALFIGIGGWGGQVLARLRGKLSQQFGDEALPTLPMLLLDTDPKSIQSASRGGRGGGLSPEETLLLPLRRPQEYREKAPSMLRWLSRRWLYNVPRSLRTEGIRPLGRLALLDHARQAMQRLRACIASAMSEESVADAADKGFTFDTSRLRIYIVSSITGGTGGAMTTDVAYAVRAILDRIGVNDAKLIGLMLHGAARGAERGELARVNAYAWLSEFQHFLRPGVAYPGDQGAGLPAHEPGTPVFDESYLLTLGDGLDANQLASGVDSAAEYLLHDAATCAQQGLEACRAASSEAPGALRTFQLHVSETAPESARNDAVQRVVAALTARWCVEDNHADSNCTTTTSHLVRGAATLVGRLQLNTAGLPALCRVAIEKAATVDSTVLPNHFDAVVEGLGAELLRDLRSRVTDPSERLVGALGAVQWYSDHLDSVARDLDGLTGQVQSEIDGKAVASSRPEALEQSLASLQAAAMVTERLREQLGAARAWISGFMEGFSAARASDQSNETTLQDERWRLLADQRLEEMVAECDHLVLDELRTHQAGLLSADCDAAREELSQRLVEIAEGVVGRILIGVSTSNPTSADSVAEDLPPLVRFGGSIRRVAVTSPQDADTLGERFGDVGPVLPITAEAEARCCLITEASGLSLPHIAGALVGGRRDYAELATRVCTRRDIAWTSPLDAPAQPPTPVHPFAVAGEDPHDIQPTSLLPS